MESLTDCFLDLHKNQWNERTDKRIISGIVLKLTVNCEPENILSHERLKLTPSENKHIIIIENWIPYHWSPASRFTLIKKKLLIVSRNRNLFCSFITRFPKKQKSPGADLVKMRETISSAEMSISFEGSVCFKVSPQVWGSSDEWKTISLNGFELEVQCLVTNELDFGL